MFMNRLKNFIVALTILALLGLGACKPEKPKDPITITYKLGEVKDYMYFKPGTWWVYEHDKTHERDSQYVTSCDYSVSTQTGREEWSKHITLQQETLSMRIRSNFKDGWGGYNFFDIYTTGQNVNAFPYPKRAYQFERSKISSVFANSSTTAFYHPFDLCSDKKQCFYYMDTTLVNHTINNYTFDTVRVFAVSYGAAVMQTPFVPTQDASAKCYYAKGYGLVKITQNTYKVLDGSPYNHSWSVVKMNILK